MGTELESFAKGCTIFMNIVLGVVDITALLLLIFYILKGIKAFRVDKEKGIDEIIKGLLLGSGIYIATTILKLGLELKSANYIYTKSLLVFSIFIFIITTVYAIFDALPKKKNYKILNILNIYKDYNGYVKKILFINNKQIGYSIEGEYYNDRERTNVAVLDGDLLLLSKYETDLREYKLVQVDYSCPTNLKELITDQDTNIILNYLIDNNLVNINEEESKQPQIGSSYVKFIIERINQEQVTNHDNTIYSLEQLEDLLSINILYKQEYYSLDELVTKVNPDDEDYELRDIILIARRSLNYAKEIFNVSGKAKLTLDEIRTYAAVCEYNYIYNL